MPGNDNDDISNRRGRSGSSQGTPSRSESRVGEGPTYRSPQGSGRPYQPSTAGRAPYTEEDYVPPQRSQRDFIPPTAGQQPQQRGGFYPSGGEVPGFDPRYNNPSGSFMPTSRFPVGFGDRQPTGFSGPAFGQQPFDQQYPRGTSQVTQPPSRSESRVGEGPTYRSPQGSGRPYQPSTAGRAPYTEEDYVPPQRSQRDFIPPTAGQQPQQRGGFYPSGGEVPGFDPRYNNPSGSFMPTSRFPVGFGDRQPTGFSGPAFGQQPFDQQYPTTGNRGQSQQGESLVQQGISRRAEDERAYTNELVQRMKEAIRQGASRGSGSDSKVIEGMEKCRDLFEALSNQYLNSDVPGKSSAEFAEQLRKNQEFTKLLQSTGLELMQTGPKSTAILGTNIPPNSLMLGAVMYDAEVLGGKNKGYKIISHRDGAMKPINLSKEASVDLYLQIDQTGRTPSDNNFLLVGTIENARNMSGMPITHAYYGSGINPDGTKVKINEGAISVGRLVNFDGIKEGASDMQYIAAKTMLYTALQAQKLTRAKEDGQSKTGLASVLQVDALTDRTRLTTVARQSTRTKNEILIDTAKKEAELAKIMRGEPLNSQLTAQAIARSLPGQSNVLNSIGNESYSQGFNTRINNNNRRVQELQQAIQSNKEEITLLEKAHKDNLQSMLEPGMRTDAINTIMAVVEADADPQIRDGNKIDIVKFAEKHIERFAISEQRDSDNIMRVAAELAATPKERFLNVVSKYQSENQSPETAFFAANVAVWQYALPMMNKAFGIGSNPEAIAKDQAMFREILSQHQNDQIVKDNAAPVAVLLLAEAGRLTKDQLDRIRNQTNYRAGTLANRGAGHSLPSQAMGDISVNAVGLDITKSEQLKVEAPTMQQTTTRRGPISATEDPPLRSSSRDSFSDDTTIDTEFDIGSPESEGTGPTESVEPPVASPIAQQTTSWPRNLVQKDVRQHRAVDTISKWEADNKDLSGSCQSLITERRSGDSDRPGYLQFNALARLITELNEEQKKRSGQKDIPTMFKEYIDEVDKTLIPEKSTMNKEQFVKALTKSLVDYMKEGLENTDYYERTDGAKKLFAPVLHDVIEKAMNNNFEDMETDELTNNAISHGNWCQELLNRTAPTMQEIQQSIGHLGTFLGRFPIREIKSVIAEIKGFDSVEQLAEHAEAEIKNNPALYAAQTRGNQGANDNRSLADLRADTAKHIGDNPVYTAQTRQAPQRQDSQLFQEARSSILGRHGSAGTTQSSPTPSSPERPPKRPKSNLTPLDEDEAKAIMAQNREYIAQLKATMRRTVGPHTSALNSKSSNPGQVPEL